MLVDVVARMAISKLVTTHYVISFELVRGQFLFLVIDSIVATPRAAESSYSSRLL